MTQPKFAQTIVGAHDPERDQLSPRRQSRRVVTGHQVVGGALHRQR